MSNLSKYVYNKCCSLIFNFFSMKNKFRKFRLIYFENRYHAKFDCQYHGLRTPNEGINQRYLEILVDAADKICFGRTEEFGIGIEFSAVQ